MQKKTKENMLKLDLRVLYYLTHRVFQRFDVEHFGSTMEIFLQPSQSHIVCIILCHRRSSGPALLAAIVVQARTEPLVVVHVAVERPSSLLPRAEVNAREFHPRG